MAGDPYKAFRNLYTVPHLAGFGGDSRLHGSWTPGEVWRTPVLDKFNAPPGYDNLRGVEPAPVVTQTPAPVMPVTSPEPTPAWMTILGVGVAGFLLGKLLR